MMKPTATPRTPKAPKSVQNPYKPDGKEYDRPLVMAHLCREIATSTRSIATILAAGADGHNLPGYSTIDRWLAEDNTLREQYARAKEVQADVMADEILAIADDGSNDWMAANDDANPGYRVNGEHIQRSKLRIDARKWLAAKLKPKSYGDKLDLNHGGKIEISQRQRDAAVAAARGGYDNQSGQE